MDNNQRDPQSSDQPAEGVVSQAPTGIADNEMLEGESGLSGPLGGSGDRTPLMGSGDR